MLLTALGGMAWGCTQSSPTTEFASSAPAGIPVQVAAPQRDSDGATAARPRIDGSAFPDKVIALTWDDGPDAQSLALAEYLHRERISATFFVVSQWIDGVSSDPGSGTGVFDTGYEHLPILGDLVALGHRVGNHTLNHVLLDAADPALIARQVRENQHRIDPFITNDLPLFRTPGGAWNAAASRAVFSDPDLARLVGPIGWDIDRKDWEGSLYCRSSEPLTECERAAPKSELRVKPRVTASRYLSTIESMGHGIVLLHDRVGHVGSNYALDVARLLIPELEARGFVFAAPVLRFSPLLVREAGEEKPPDLSSDIPSDRGPIRIADIDGDGRGEVCAPSLRGFACATSRELQRIAGPSPQTILARVELRSPAFGDRVAWEPTIGAGTIRWGDVDGDGHVDVCARSREGIQCATNDGMGGLRSPMWWSASRPRGGGNSADFSDAGGWGSDPGYCDTIDLADVDGDGKADVCGRGPMGIVCARSLGYAFEDARPWLADMTGRERWLPIEGGATIAFADVDGDGRADVCARIHDGIHCALSTATRFAAPHAWSSGTDFSDADTTPWNEDAGYYGTIRMADLNGDGRADVCGRSRDGVVCALSTGQSLTRTTNWLPEMSDEGGWSRREYSETIALGDINGDGRADLCGRGGHGVVCAFAP